jgi:hypothetical protein
MSEIVARAIRFPLRGEGNAKSYRLRNRRAIENEGAFRASFWAPGKLHGVISITHGSDNLSGMNTKALIAQIDTELAKLQNARTVLLSLDSAPTKGKRGRPKRSGAKKAAPKKGRKMSAEGRARIAAAQKKRWAAAKKTAAWARVAVITRRRRGQ